MFEGRDQLKLKDKARNIKEKYIRYFPPLVVQRIPGDLTLIGVGREERCRGILRWLRRWGILVRRRLGWKLWLLIGRDCENYFVMYCLFVSAKYMRCNFSVNVVM